MKSVKEVLYEYFQNVDDDQIEDVVYEMYGEVVELFLDVIDKGISDATSQQMKDFIDAKEKEIQESNTDGLETSSSHE